MNKKIGWLLLWILPVFLLYFISESFLRCAAIANINPEKVNLDRILNELPEKVRDIVSYRIMHTDLTNQLAAATEEKVQISLMVQLGLLTRDLEEKEKIFHLLRQKYPNDPEVASAFIYYLLKKDSPECISIPEFHKYLLKFPQLERYNIWAMGLDKLNRMKVPESERLTFLMPLLNMTPEYRDYSMFYTEIVRLAVRCRQNQTANRADKLLDDSRMCPSIMEVLMEREQLLMQKQKQSKKKGK